MYWIRVRFVNCGCIAMKVSSAPQKAEIYHFIDVDIRLPRQHSIWRMLTCSHVACLTVSPRPINYSPLHHSEDSLNLITDIGSWPGQEIWIIGISLRRGLCDVTHYGRMVMEAEFNQMRQFRCSHDVRGGQTHSSSSPQMSEVPHCTTNRTDRTWQGHGQVQDSISRYRAAKVGPIWRNGSHWTELDVSI